MCNVRTELGTFRTDQQSFEHITSTTRSLVHADTHLEIVTHREKTLVQFSTTWSLHSLDRKPHHTGGLGFLAAFELSLIWKQTTFR